MNFKVIRWGEAESEALRLLYKNYLYPTYWGSPILNEELQDYRYRKINREAQDSPDDNMFVVEANGKLFCAAKLARIDHLSDQFKVEVASIENEAFICEQSQDLYFAAFELFRALRAEAVNRKIILVSASVASMAFQWHRALEDSGFRYADGFLHMVSSFKDNYDASILDDIVIRDPIPSDFEEIEYSYKQVPFPSHWLYESEFDKELMAQLYAKRYKDVYETKNGRILVGELNGQFASALICMIDKEIQKETGIIVNPTSMGIIVHPRAERRGVSLSLVASRHNYYREMGLKYGYFGANINNYKMIRGLEKMGMRFSGININMMLRL